jgi:hypothetical protein
MIDNRKTVSDEIITYFRKKGFKDKLTNAAAKEAAIVFSHKYTKDLYEIKDK